MSGRVDADEQRAEFAEALGLDPGDYRWIRRAGRWAGRGHGRAGLSGTVRQIGVECALSGVRKLH